jgi:hypothetical protein
LQYWWDFGGFMSEFDPELKSYANQSLSEPLWEAARDDQYSWWQRREMIRLAAQISCSESNHEVAWVLNSGRTEFRTALYQGCFSRNYELAGFLVLTALKDSGLSYHRFMALRYLRGQDKLNQYRDDILNLRSDSSQMVRYEVGEILKYMQPEPGLHR